MKNSRKGLKIIYLQYICNTTRTNSWKLTIKRVHRRKNKIFLVRFLCSSNVDYIIPSHFYMFSLAILT